MWKRVISVWILVLVFFFLKRSFFPNEADRIRAVLSTVVEKIQTSATEHPIARAQDIRALAKNFAEDIEFQLDNPEEEVRVVKSRKELESQALAAKVSMKSLEVLMLPPTVRIDGDRAKAVAEIHVLGSLSEVDGQFYERHTVTFLLKKEDAGWKIEKISTVNLRGKDGAKEVPPPHLQ